jgi:hypothetical protein
MWRLWIKGILSYRVDKEKPTEDRTDKLIAEYPLYNLCEGIITYFFANNQFLIQHDFWISGKRQMTIKLDVWESIVTNTGVPSEDRTSDSISKTVDDG